MDNFFIIFISCMLAAICVALYFFPPSWKNFFVVKKPVKSKKRILLQKSKYTPPKLGESAGARPLVETYDDDEL